MNTAECELNMFDLVICDPNKPLCDELEKAFSPFGVSVYCDVFQRMHFDCIVSPGNSFGLMDGGMDGAIIDHFGLELQSKVQSAIIREYGWEQPVGTSMVLAIDNTEPRKYLAHTPTMRVPEDLNGTDNVYRAMKAMLLAVERHNLVMKDIRTVVCSGLGSLTGALPYDKVAGQMSLAYSYFKRQRPLSLNWDHAVSVTQNIKNFT